MAPLCGIKHRIEGTTPLTNYLQKKTSDVADFRHTQMQVGGAQRRSMVHSVVLYSQGGEQRKSHKPTQKYAISKSL